MAVDQNAALGKRLGDDKRDRLKQLRAFCHTARLGSITRAAEQVFSSQPSVSIQIRALEDSLGNALFERKGPRVTLTLAGRKLYELAAPLVEDIDRLPDAFAEQYEGISGELRIAAGEAAATFILPRILIPLREQQPGIHVNVRIGTGYQCLSWLRTYEVDLFFAAMDSRPSNVFVHSVLSYDYLLITPWDHPLHDRESVSVREMCDYPLIAHTSGAHFRHFSEIYLQHEGAALDIVVYVDGWDVIKEYVEAGLGIAAVPDMCLRDEDRVRRIPIEDYFPPQRYGVVTRRDRLLPLAVRRFIRIADTSLRAGL